MVYAVSILCLVASCNAMEHSRQVSAKLSSDQLTYNVYSQPEFNLSKLYTDRIDLSDAECILDMDCGTGLTVLHLADSASHATIEGCDCSAHMIEQAQKNLFLSPYAEGDRIKFFVANILKDQFVENRYSHIFCFSVFHRLKERPELLKKIKNALKHGGTFCMTMWAEEDRSKSKLYSALQDTVSHWRNFAQDIRWQKNFSQENFEQEMARMIISRMLLTTSFQRAGFKNITIEEIERCVEFRDSVGVVKWLMSWASSLSFLAQFDNDTKKAFMKKVVEKYQEHCAPDDTFKITVPTLVGFATK